MRYWMVTESCWPMRWTRSSACTRIYNQSHVIRNQTKHEPYKSNKRMRPLRGRPLWGCPCSWVRTDGGNSRCHGNEVTRGKAARVPYDTCQICHLYMQINQSAWEILIIRLTLTQLLCPVTLTFDPLTLKLVHGVLVSRGPFLPSLVFVGLFVFPLGGGTGQTDGQDQHMIGYPSMKDGPIITLVMWYTTTIWEHAVLSATQRRWTCPL